MNADARDEPLFANLSDDDPALLAAVIEAKKSLSKFKFAVSTMRFSPATYLVKVPFLDRSDTGEEGLIRTAKVGFEKPTQPICHLWLTVTSVLGDLVFCSIGEAPVQLRLKTGTSFVVEDGAIEDWMINHRGEVYGGFSLRVIRNRLHEHARVRFAEHTRIREFKDLMT